MQMATSSGSEQHCRWQPTQAQNNIAQNNVAQNNIADGNLLRIRTNLQMATYSGSEQHCSEQHCRWQPTQALVDECALCHLRSHCPCLSSALTACKIHKHQLAQDNLHLRHNNFRQVFEATARLPTRLVSSGRNTVADLRRMQVKFA